MIKLVTPKPKAIPVLDLLNPVYIIYLNGVDITNKVRIGENVRSIELTDTLSIGSETEYSRKATIRFTDPYFSITDLGWYPTAGFNDLDVVVITIGIGYYGYVSIIDDYSIKSYEALYSPSSGNTSVMELEQVGAAADAVKTVLGSADYKDARAIDILVDIARELDGIDRFVFNTQFGEYIYSLSDLASGGKRIGVPSSLYDKLESFYRPANMSPMTAIAMLGRHAMLEAGIVGFNENGKRVYGLRFDETLFEKVGNVVVPKYLAKDPHVITFSEHNSLLISVTFRVNFENEEVHVADDIDIPTGKEKAFSVRRSDVYLTPDESGRLNVVSEVTSEKPGNVVKHITKPGDLDDRLIDNLTASMIDSLFKITVDCTIVGYPFIFPPDVVEFRGFSVFSHKYFVTSVSHTFNSSGYVTKFSATTEFPSTGQVRDIIAEKSGLASLDRSDVFVKVTPEGDLYTVEEKPSR